MSHDSCGGGARSSVIAVDAVSVTTRGRAGALRGGMLAAAARRACRRGDGAIRAARLFAPRRRQATGAAGGAYTPDGSRKEQDPFIAWLRALAGSLLRV